MDLEIDQSAYFQNASTERNLSKALTLTQLYGMTRLIFSKFLEIDD